MERLVGTVSRGVRAPIIREGDDLAKIVVDSVLAAGKSEGFSFHDRDVVAVTEAVVARAQGNYAHINDIAADVKNKLGGETIGVIFPILSRNRFSVCLKGIARGAKKVVLMLSFPADEVGNHLIDEELLDAANMIEGEKVQIMDINNGERFETYIIKGERGSGAICLNGAAARKVQVGDVVIIASYALMDFEDAKAFRPWIVFPDTETNRLIR